MMLQTLQALCAAAAAAAHIADELTQQHGSQCSYLK
jgi:hypothetical protein